MPLRLGLSCQSTSALSQVRMHWSVTILLVTVLQACAGRKQHLQNPLRQNRYVSTSECTSSRLSTHVQGQRAIYNVSLIYRLISMYNGSDSNTSAHTRFAKPLELCHLKLCLASAVYIYTGVLVLKTLRREPASTEVLSNKAYTRLHILRCTVR